MQNVQVLLQPTEIDTQPLWVESRRAGSVDGKISSDSRISSCASPLWRARSSRVGERAHVVGAEDDVDPGRLVEDDALVLLGEAAADGDLHALVLAFDAGEVAEGAVELVVGVLADRAGVDDDDVGGAAVGPDVAGGLERSAEPLGVVHVHLAAERAHLVGARDARAPPRLRGGHWS